MKNRLLPAAVRQSERVITKFGQASIGWLAGWFPGIARAEIRIDQTSAKEWISLFMHEAVPRLIQPMDSSSTSNISVALGGIAPG